MSTCTLIFLKPGFTFAQQQTPSDIQSDNTWRVSKIEEAWWHAINFDDSHWAFATAPSNGVCDVFMQPQPHVAAPMWAPTPQAGDAVYFRKKFMLSNKPEKAVLKTVFDDDGDIYVNSTLVRRDRSGTVNSEVFIDDISYLLQEGANVIGLYVVDSHGGCQSAQARVDLELTYEDHVLDVPLFKQDAPLWKSDMYAGGAQDKLDCGKTLESCGCATTSTAMILKYLGAIKSPSGEETSPQALNNYFKNGQKCTSTGCISNGYAFGAVRWAAVEQYASEAFKKYGTQKIEWVDRTTPSIESIKSEINKNNPVALQSPDKKHWFVGYGVKQDNILIRDPLFARDKFSDPAYQNKASAMVRFKKTNSDFRLVQVISAPGQRMLVVDPLGRKVGYNNQTKEIINEIPQATYHFEEFIDKSSQSISDRTSQAQQTQQNKSGVWIATIRLPELGEYNVDVDDSQANKKFAVAIYSSNKAGDLLYDLEEGTALKGADFESSFTYSDVAVGQNKPFLLVHHKMTNKMRLCKKFPKHISVNLYSELRFDATKVKVATLRLLGQSILKYNIKDLNKDGKMDMIVSFNFKNRPLNCKPKEVILTGEDKTNEMFRRVYQLEKAKSQIAM
jgi:hypothetical protein